MKQLFHQQPLGLGSRSHRCREDYQATFSRPREQSTLGVDIPAAMRQGGPRGACSVAQIITHLQTDKCRRRLTSVLRLALLTDKGVAPGFFPRKILAPGLEKSTKTTRK